MNDQTLVIDPKTEAVFKKKGYKLDKLLSHGAYGWVYKGTYNKVDPPDTIAIKVKDLQKMDDKFAEKFLPRELEALIGVKHENACFIYDIIRANHKMYIFMEFCDSGDIAGYLKKNGAIDEPKTAVWWTQAAQGLKFMHEHLHMAHRDIKVDSIMLTKEKNTSGQQLIAKLTNFGFARKCWNEQTNAPEISKTFCGTEPYYSPQIVSRKPYLPFAADVWAMGCVLFCMLNNKFPFHSGDAKKMLKEQMDREYINGRFTKEFADDLKDLHYRLWEVDEKKRSKISDVLKHQWVKRKGK